MGLICRAYLLRCCLLCCTVVVACGQTRLGENKQDEPKSFDAARAVSDTQARIAALQAFIREFPSGSHHASAEQLLLETLLTASPLNSAAIHAVASDQVLAALPGLERWMEEARLANMLADAGTDGVDLSDASAWAHDAVSSLSEASYRRQVALMRARYRLPSLTQRQIRAEYAHDRATALAALANVLLQAKRTADADLLIVEAAHLDPLSAEVNRLQAQSLLAKGQRQQALDAFIKADAISPLPPRWRQQETVLFSELEHGDETALDQRVDESYRKLYPPVFALPNRPPVAGGHPALLELFTGSDCLPCAGPDLAVDSLLGSYTRSDLIALEFDEHIPRPDPLATPETVERAAFYAVESTPNAYLDGQPLQILGSTREDAENIVVGFAEQIEETSSLPSGLRIDLHARKTSPTGISAQLSLATSTVSARPSETTGNTSLRALQSAVLYVALVQDNLRYPGKNGVRFHRMVVRALRTAPASNFLVASDQPRSMAFDLASIQNDLRTYLTDYETHNNRFGAFQFPRTEFPLSADQLAIVAWVQDPRTKQVLQSAFAPIPPN